MKNKLILTLGLILGIFCVSTLLLTPVNADDEPTKPAVWLQISPVSKRLALEPGTTHEDSFIVENVGSEDFTFKVYASPYSVTNEDYNLSFTNENKFTQITRWIKFDQTQYELAVGEQQIVKFYIEVPEDVPAGGQYATIFAESGGKNTSMQSSGIKTVSRVGLVIYANLPGETNQTAELLDYSLPRFYLKGNIAASSKIANSGNTDFEGRYRLEIRPIIGDIIYEKDEIYSLLPETERRVEMLWDQTPMLGLFKVNYSVTAPDISSDETRLVLIVPLFVIIITLLLLTFIAVWIIITVKRRKGLRSKIRI